MPDEIVIVDAKGVEHVFPAGMDPMKAAAIVRSQGMPSAPTRLGSAKTGGMASDNQNLAPDFGEVLGGIAENFNPMNYARAVKGLLTTRPDKTIAGLVTGLKDSAGRILSGGADDSNASREIGRFLGAPMVGGAVKGVGSAIRKPAGSIMDMGLQRTMADRLEFPNTPQRLVDEGIVPRGKNVQNALTATEGKINREAAAFDAANPIGRVDPDTLAQQASDFAFKEGKVGGLGNVPGPEVAEIDKLKQGYLAQNTRTRGLGETIAQKRSYQARSNYDSRPNAPTQTGNELNFNKGIASANREAAIGMNPALADDLFKERDLMGALTAQTKMDAKSTPLSTVGTLKTLAGLRNPTLMGGAAIGLDRTGRAIQATAPWAQRAALLALMRSHAPE